jgi:hypothetical protein
VFCPRLSGAGKEVLDLLANHADFLEKNNVRLFAITLERTQVLSSQELNFPVIFDEQKTTFEKFRAPHDRASTIVIRRNYHVAGNFSGEAKSQVDNVLSVLEGSAWERTPTLMSIHPPVLLIPEVFSHEDCRKLIKIFETSGQTFIQERAALDYLNGSDYKMRIPEHMREDRIDHFFYEKETVAFLINRLTRVTPEIHKAFQYRITKYETLRVARYNGQRGGYSHGHRDNIPPFTYRRFAMSINLNTEEFDGGELRFPEFGNQRYRPETGTAIIFSSSLLHEALHVTDGQRFVFLAFLFGES